MVRDPLELWIKLKERYNHMKSVVLPQAQYAWQHLRLQDFKFVSEYNSALFDIVTQLELCGVKVSEADMLERIFSIFYASNIILQQQYQQRNFTKYSELISVLLTAEKTNELLKNMILGPLDQQQYLKHMQMLIKILANLEAIGIDKKEVFVGVTMIRPK